MLVIVASRWDRAATALAARWAAHDAQILTPRDLSFAGWRQRLNEVTGGTAVVNSSVIAQEQISGVLTLLRSVSEDELDDIASRDRPYVAAEMTAFLLFWLSHLRCTVLNRATPTCLSGPHWRQEKWTQVAALAGIGVRPVRRLAEFGHSCPAEQAAAGEIAVTVVGPRTFGDAHPDLHRHARQLADWARVELVRIRFSGPEQDARFLGADTFPPLADDGLADSVLEYLSGAIAVPA
jgi:hypothetical protein